MTLSQWRQNEDLVAWASKLFRHANWKLLREAMDGEHIRHGQLRPIGPSETDCSRQLGKIEGWDTYATTLESAGIPDTPVGPMPQATFSDPTKG